MTLWSRGHKNVSFERFEGHIMTLYFQRTIAQYTNKKLFTPPQQESS